MYANDHAEPNGPRVVVAVPQGVHSGQTEHGQDDAQVLQRAQPKRAMDTYEPSAHRAVQ